VITKKDVKYCFTNVDIRTIIKIQPTKGNHMWNAEEIEAISKDTDYHRKSLQQQQSDKIDSAMEIADDPELVQLYRLEK
jgi:hypothetical protein